MIHGRWQNLQILVVMPAAVFDWDDVVNVVLDSGLLRELFGSISHLLFNQEIVIRVKLVSFQCSAA